MGGVGESSRVGGIGETSFEATRALRLHGANGSGHAQPGYERAERDADLTGEAMGETRRGKIDLVGHFGQPRSPSLSDGSLHREKRRLGLAGKDNLTRARPQQMQHPTIDETEPLRSRGIFRGNGLAEHGVPNRRAEPLALSFRPRSERIEPSSDRAVPLHEHHDDTGSGYVEGMLDPRGNQRDRCRTRLAIRRPGERCSVRHDDLHGVVGVSFGRERHAHVHDATWPEHERAHELRSDTKRALASTTVVLPDAAPRVLMAA